MPDCSESRGRSRYAGLDMANSTGVGGPLEESEEIEPIARRGTLRGRLDPWTCRGMLVEDQSEEREGAQSVRYLGYAHLTRPRYLMPPTQVW